jgi:hypothetical protein
MRSGDFDRSAASARWLVPEVHGEFWYVVDQLRRW